MHRLEISVVGLSALALLACGDGQLTPSAACHEMAEVTCSRMIACLTAEQLIARGLPGTHAACVAAVSAQQACASRTETNTCASGEIYQPDEARACIDEVATKSCSELDGGIVVGDDTPRPPTGSCDRVCLAEGADQLGQPCDVSNQAACGPGNKCSFVLENPDTGYGTSKCVPDGERGPGASCYSGNSYGSYDDCRAGLVCRERQCQPICLTQSECDASQLCIADRSEDPFGFCVARCDPFSQSCPASQGCYPWDASTSVCLREGVGASSCERPEDCARGSTCVTVDGIPRCEPMCNAGLYEGQRAPQCSSLETCFALINRTDGIGVCLYDPA